MLNTSPGNLFLVTNQTIYGKYSNLSSSRILSNPPHLYLNLTLGLTVQIVEWVSRPYTSLRGRLVGRLRCIGEIGGG